MRSGKSGKSGDAYRHGWLSVIPRGAVHDDRPHVLVQPGVGLRVDGLAPELGP